jgi:hypothetical protein
MTPSVLFACFLFGMLYFAFSLPSYALHSLKAAVVAAVVARRAQAVREL